MLVWYGAAKEIGVGPDFESVPESVLFQKKLELGTWGMKGNVEEMVGGSMLQILNLTGE